MASETEICKLALLRARAGSIGSLEEESPEAIECNILYPLSRNYVLEAFAWSFANKVVALQDTGTEPAEWSYEYGYPNDCLRIWYLLPPGVGQAILKNHIGSIEFDPAPYKVGMADDDTKRVIRTNQDQAYISYTSRVTNPDLFTGIFVQTLAWHLAADLAISFGGDSGRSISQMCREQFQMRLAEATALDANQEQKPIRKLPRSLAARTSAMPSHYYYNGQLFRRY